MFEYLGNRTQEFLAYSDEGAIFMFGPDFRDHFFGFAVSEKTFGPWDQGISCYSVCSFTGQGCSQELRGGVCVQKVWGPNRTLVGGGLIRGPQETQRFSELWKQFPEVKCVNLGNVGGRVLSATPHPWLQPWFPSYFAPYLLNIPLLCLILSVIYMTDTLYLIACGRLSVQIPAATDLSRKNRLWQLHC